MTLDTPLIRRLIDLAIEEDLPAGDLTANLAVPAGMRSVGYVVAREDLVFCGAEVIRLVCRAFDRDLAVETLLEDGAEAGPETRLATVRGSARSVLAIERTILNFAQRLSGVATWTRETVSKSAGLQILDTRKTMPGWRQLDKYAVRVGGARNHRGNLSEMILVKNNHVDAHPAGMPGVLEAVMKNKPLYTRVEVEVRTIDELKTALPFEPDVIMLDNFGDLDIKKAFEELAKAPRRPLIEASGGVTADRFAFLQAAGVDAVSLGALTTRARNVDISMRISREPV